MMTSHVLHPTSNNSPRRVSRFFAMGFRCAELERTEGQLSMSQCANEWQRDEMRSGFGAQQDGPTSHVQFWLVSGDAQGSHEHIEEEILTTEYTEHTEGE